VLLRHRDERGALSGRGPVVYEDCRTRGCRGAADFANAEILIAGDGGHDREPVQRDAVEVASINFPHEQRLATGCRGLAVHDASAGEHLCGSRFNVGAAD